jgi:quercetin dioxygenase-like cupin family protein
MIFTTLAEAPSVPVSHDPRLKKKLLLGPGTLPHVASLSHIELDPGDTAVSHSHEDAYEVFFGLGGKVAFTVGGAPVELQEGSCLVVEPGEAHSITGAERGSRVLYFLLKR